MAVVWYSSRIPLILYELTEVDDVQEFTRTLFVRYLVFIVIPDATEDGIQLGNNEILV